MLAGRKRGNFKGLWSSSGRCRGRVYCLFWFFTSYFRNNVFAIGAQDFRTLKFGARINVLNGVLALEERLSLNYWIACPIENYFLREFVSWSFEKVARLFLE